MEISRKKLQLLAMAISLFVFARISVQFLPRYTAFLVIVALLCRQLFIVLPSKLRAAAHFPVPQTQPTTPPLPQFPSTHITVSKSHPLKHDTKLPPPPTLDVTETEHDKLRFPTLVMTFGKVKRFCLNREAASDRKRRVVDLPNQAEPYREDGGIAIVLQKNEDDDEYREEHMRVGFRAICRLIRRLDLSNFTNVRLTMPDVVPFSNFRLKDAGGKGTRLRRLEYSGDFTSFPVLCNPVPSFPFHLLETLRITKCRISVRDCVAILCLGSSLKAVKLETVADCQSILTEFPTSVSEVKIEKLWISSDVDLAFLFEMLSMHQLKELVFASLPENVKLTEYSLNWAYPPTFKICKGILHTFPKDRIVRKIQVDMVEGEYDI